MNKQDVLNLIQDRIKSIHGNGVSVILGPDTPLIGEGSLLDSMGLVELCLSLEDMASQFDKDFDWTSEAAMSRSRSMFRTIEALADEYLRQVAS